VKVIVCGAGQVGFNIARYLSSENADVTVIDQAPELVQKISESLDVTGLVGFASHPDVLEQAGARDADMLIAVTYADEVNMVACQVAHSIFEVPTKIARVRHQAYLNPLWSDLFSHDHMPIDVIISPEVEVAKAIARRLQVPGAFDAMQLADGRVNLIGVHVREDTPIIQTPLRQLTDLFPDLNLARAVEEKHPQVQLKIIEVSKSRAEFVAQTLERSVVIHGDALDLEILTEANIAATETVIAVSNDDEVNILASLLAKRYGAKRAITLINSASYSQLVGSLGIDTVVSPRAITVSTILQHVRRGRIRSVYSLAEGIGEIIEAEAMETSGLVGRPLRDAPLPNGSVVGAVVRDEEVIIPRGDTVIRAGDLVVMFAAAEAVKKVEKLFAVKLEFF
jgi:trk system potassium uptake protein TrkA